MGSTSTGTLKLQAYSPKNEIKSCSTRLRVGRIWGEVLHIFGASQQNSAVDGDFKSHYVKTLKTTRLL